MVRRSEPAEAPLYVRWTPDQSPIAIELRLDLIARIRELIAAAESTGIEIGGILVGTAPTATTPTIRIDDMVAIDRRPEDGPVFMLDPREHDRFLTTRWNSRSQGRSVLGFFRSHMRPGPLRPSLADRTILASQFNEDAYVVLLIDGREPHRSALFLGSRERLPDQPSVPEFLFHEKEFSSLPEDEPALMPGGASGGPNRLLWAALLAIVFALVAVVILRWVHSGESLEAADHGLGLQVTGGSILTISWNHAGADLNRAIAARLIIADGNSTREVPVGADELRLGTVEYRHVADQVKVTFVINMPGSTTIEQSVDWHNEAANHSE